MISVEGSRELQAVILALKTTSKELRPEMYKRTRESILPDWEGGINDKLGAYGATRFNVALLKGTRVKVGTQGVAVLAAQSRRKISKGSTLTPQEHYYLAEYGASPKVVPVNGRRGNTRYNYKRTVNTHTLRPARKGRFANPTAGEIVSRSVALWVKTVVQVMNGAVEKGEK